jgi:hypothetical protein
VVIYDEVLDIDAFARHFPRSSDQSAQGLSVGCENNGRVDGQPARNQFGKADDVWDASRSAKNARLDSDFSDSTMLRVIRVSVRQSLKENFEFMQQWHGGWIKQGGYKCNI